MKIKLTLLLVLFSAICEGQVSNFCHTGLNGNTTKIILMNGGKGKINILNNDVLKRSGNISWSSTTSNFPNPEIVRIKLSTGAILRFEAVKYNQLSGKIDMLIDSRGNQYISCVNNIYREVEEDEETKARDAVYEKNSKAIREFRENKMDSYFEELQGTWTIVSDKKDIYIVIEKDKEKPDNLIVKSYRLLFKTNRVEKSTERKSKFYLKSEYADLYNPDFKWILKLEFGDKWITFNPQDFDASKQLNYKTKKYSDFGNYIGVNSTKLIKTTKREDLMLLDSIDGFNENLADYSGFINKETNRYKSEMDVDFPILFEECLDDYKKQDLNSAENSFKYYLSFAKENAQNYSIIGELKRCFYINTSKHIQKEKTLKGVSGRVYLELGVVKDGSIGHVKLSRGVNKMMNQEAIRIIKALPPLIPAIKDGKYVSSSVNIAITFK